MANWRFSGFYFFYFATVGVLVPYWSLYLQYLEFNATEIGQLTAILVLTRVAAPNIWAAIADNMSANKGHSIGILKWATGSALAIFCLMFFVDPHSKISNFAFLDRYGVVALISFGYSIFGTLVYLRLKRQP